MTTDVAGRTLVAPDSDWIPEWSNAVFSIEERDRRWAKVRALMARDGMDAIVCLGCTNHHDRGQADARYLTQLGENSDETLVLFPLQGDVFGWHTRGGAWPGSNWLHTVHAARRGTGGRTTAAKLRELGFEKGTIGVAGLTSGLLGHARETEGEANWQSVETLKSAFPEARIVSATDLLGEARYVKSDEEIAFLRKGSEVAEQTLNAIVAHARAGVPEREVFGQMMLANARAGGSFQPMFGWTSGPAGHPYHRVEQPSFRSFQAGDMLSVEIEGRWGGYIAQIDETFSIGPAPDLLKEGMQLAWEAFNRVFERMKPGVRVVDLMEAGRVTGLGGRAVTSLLMHGRGLGDDGPLLTAPPAPPEMRALELQAGCCMVVKPGVEIDGRPGYGSWGEGVVVTAQGAERLGTRQQTLYELR